MDITKSQEQADIIRSIAISVILLDTEYCKQAAQEFKDQASRQESMAVFNPSHSQTKNDILRMQGIALEFLCKYVESLKEVELLKTNLSSENADRDKINRLFM